MQNFLVSGGTGTFGKAFARHVLTNSLANRLVLFARHEVEMAQAEKELAPLDKNCVLRCYIGDIRDSDRLEMAMQNIDTVIHAAALKRIEQCERDPIEAVKTNVLGSINVLTAAIRTGVSRCILLSTDKAVAPINLYGSTKLTAERVFLAANNIVGGRCKFSVARYGNIFGSRGSVVPVWHERVAQGEPITITDPEATRYFMTIDDAVDLVLTLVESMQGGEIALPTLRAYRLGDLADAFMAASSYEHLASQITSLPSYEKLHETLDGFTDSGQAQRITIAELREAIDKL